MHLAFRHRVIKTQLTVSGSARSMRTVKRFDKCGAELRTFGRLCRLEITASLPLLPLFSVQWYSRVDLLVTCLEVLVMVRCNGDDL